MYISVKIELYSKLILDSYFPLISIAVTKKV